MKAPLAIYPRSLSIVNVPKLTRLNLTHNTHEFIIILKLNLYLVLATNLLDLDIGV